MAKTLVGLIPHLQEAQAAVRELDDAGIPSDAVTLVMQDEPELENRFKSIGIPEQDANIYARGVHDGRNVVVVQGVADQDAEQVAEIIDRHQAIDISTLKQMFQRMGIDRSAATTGAATTGAATMSGTATRTSPPNTNLYQGDEIALPIIEEELRVGKRQVERGGVRVRTRVEERPVEQQVTLREEHVDVQRRPVNRAVTDADRAQLQSGPIEVTESAEQAVVSKEARVVEEVVVSKEATQHTETVRDTVRRTDVDVEQVPGQTTTTGSTMGTTGTSGSARRTSGTAGDEDMRERGG